jgi:hypothetical protein
MDTTAAATVAVTTVVAMAAVVTIETKADIASDARCAAIEPVRQHDRLSK